MNKPAASLLALLVIFAIGTTAADTPQAAPATGPQPAAQAAPAPALPLRIDAWAGAPAASKELFARVDALATAGTWKTAWGLLRSADPDNKDPWVLARSIELVLDGYIDTEAHLSFTLEDLPPGMKAEQFRQAETGKGDTEFAPLTLAEAQAGSGIAAVPALEKALGRYFSEVVRLYPGNWLLTDSEVTQRLLDAYSKARGAGVYDVSSLQIESEALLRMGAAPDAEVLLIGAEKLDPAAVRVRYDHAVSLLMQERALEALPIIDAALKTDDNPSSRISGFNLAAQAASIAGDAARASAYLDTSEKEAPDRPEPGLFRQYLAVSKGDSQAAHAAATALLDHFGPNPQLISSLISTWFQAGQAADAVAFLDGGLVRYADSDEGASAFGFYKAVVMMQLAGSAADLEAIGPVVDAAEARFHKIFAPDHSVFSVIANLREEIKGRLAEASAGSVAGPQLPPDQGPSVPAPKP
jgi:tetratricopeptide (TPR) repeat protein